MGVSSSSSAQCLDSDRQFQPILKQNLELHKLVKVTGY